ncbi:probable RPL39-60S large subunit ribosomal protein L39.e [Fusarium fujikuroi]|uniref:Large ribosomal subunit protein eL39 n=2 Tax=Fusarium fujikuroi species complex TaxID=171627 RepID=S0DU20_GIBF5|nr:probable RPL39-60S large subunit ribosomal protein L39.e [Fusarium fujikuroi IMI 58289]XP_031080404.1 putative RPL39-60S large subunit ribosomal protein L39.e [Fusarium proliferatum ET1]CVL13757.1 probable RPL39-60S large subunit ribosomal protein L39.e [Fusarium proliferatum]SCN77208.1 probable RPL39-60S large subunit ribosomal protein L39.e [Fusarium fujikuroi]CCT65955.1 probable RPL39-60S large subunit ribosomal protein L39.e [Fusarium fujikuroi IMI 58289]CZR39811.1 probable RPL39-60S la
MTGGPVDLASLTLEIPRNKCTAFRYSITIWQRLTDSTINAVKMPSHKSFRTKQKLAKAQKQNRPVPQWIRLRTGNTIRYNAKRRHWRKTRIGI